MEDNDSTQNTLDPVILDSHKKIKLIFTDEAYKHILKMVNKKLSMEDACVKFVYDKYSSCHEYPRLSYLGLNSAYVTQQSKLYRQYDEAVAQGKEPPITPGLSIINYLLYLLK